MNAEDWRKAKLAERDIETNAFLVKLRDGKFGHTTGETDDELEYLLGPLPKQPEPAVNLLLGHMQNLCDAYNGGHGDVEMALHDIFEDWRKQGWVT